MFSIDVRDVAELLISSRAPYMTNVVPVQKLGKSSTIAKLSRKRRLDTGAEPKTAIVNQKSVLNATKAGENFHLFPKASVV